MDETKVKFEKRIVLKLAVVIYIGLAVCGCQSVSTIDPNDIKQVAEDVNSLIARVDAYQQAATAAMESLAASGAIDPNKAAEILAANADVDRLQATVQKITAALQTADYGGETGLLTLITAAQSANAATAPWNPYVGVIAAAGTILSTILGISLKKKSSEASASALKYKAHKQGAEKTMKEVSVATDNEVKRIETLLYKNIGEARAVLGVT